MSHKAYIPAATLERVHNTYKLKPDPIPEPPETLASLEAEMLWRWQHKMDLGDLTTRHRRLQYALMGIKWEDGE